MGNQGKIDSKVVAIIIVVIVALLGVFWFLMRDDGNNDDNKSATSSSQSNKSESLDYNGSLASLASAGKARKCTMNYSDESGGTGTGTSYTDGKGKSRLTITVTNSDGKQSTINTIVKDGKSYAWFVSGEQSFGYISDAKVPQGDDKAQATTTAPSGTVSPDKKFSMKCVSWSVDTSQFDVPTTINFITLPTSSSTTQP